MPGEGIRITNLWHKFLWFNDKQPWKKKDAKNYFEVTMGSYDEGEICELGN